MNLDELISKYLDGELSEAEDKYFRKVLSEDDTAREKFDSAMNLHIAFKEDAESVHPPQKLVEQTEDIIMMKIFAKAPENKRRKPIFWLNPQMIAAAIVIMLFLFVFNINENVNYNGSENNVSQKASNQLTDNNNLQKDLAINEEAFKNTIQSKGGAIQQVNMKKSIAKKESTIEIESNTQNNDIMSNALVFNNNPRTLSMTMESKSEEANEKLNEEIVFQSKTNTEILAFNPNSSEVKDLNLNVLTRFQPTNSQDIAIQNSDKKITLSSFFGTDFARGGMTNDNSVVSHFSQAVSYEIDEDESFGFEVGFSQYAYNEEAEITVEKSLGQLSTGSTIESNESGIDFSIAYPQVINVKSNTQILWASAFYERTLYQLEDVDFVTRLGAGFSNDGIIGYSKLFMQYQLFSGVKFTLGAEGRLFQANVNKFLGQKSNFKSSATLIYGLQFTF